MFKNKKVVTAAVVAGLLGGMFLLDKSDLLTAFAAPKGTEAVLPQTQVTVQTVQAKEELRNHSAAYKATLEPAEQALVSAQTSGKVVRILFESGTAVSQNMPLVMLDDRDARSMLQVAQGQLESAKAGLMKAETSLASTVLSYDRINALYQQGAASKAEYDSAQSALNMVKADTASARAAVQAAMGTLEARKTALDNTIIRSPLSGIAAGKNVSLGQQVTPEAVLAKVMQVTAVDAVFEVDQEAVGALRVGQEAELKLQKTSNETFTGMIRTVDIAADPASRVFTVRVRIDNPQQLLRPGVFGWVLLASDKPLPVLTLPIEAVTGKEGEYSVFTADSGVARRNAVQLGEVADNRVEILSGITAGSRVILTNLNTLQDGDSVTVSAE